MTFQQWLKHFVAWLRVFPRWWDDDDHCYMGVVGDSRFECLICHTAYHEFEDDSDAAVHKCGTCGARLEHVRPGHWQCPECN